MSIINFINTGTGVNSGDGDSLRVAFSKTNANFQSLVDNFVAAGVTTFNDQVGSVRFGNAEIVAQLGYVPYSAANPNNYITSSTISLTNYAQKTYVDSTFVTQTALGNFNYVTKNYVDASLTEYATTLYVNNQGFLTPTTLPNYLTLYPTITDLATTAQNLRNYTTTTIFNSVNNTDIIPSEAGAFNLGQEAYTWGNLYLGGAIYMNGSGIRVDATSGRLFVNGNDVIANFTLLPQAIYSGYNTGFTISAKYHPENSTTGWAAIKFPSDELIAYDSLRIYNTATTTGVKLEGRTSAISIDDGATSTGTRFTGNILTPVTFYGKPYLSTATNTASLTIFPPEVQSFIHHNDLAIPQQIKSFASTTTFAPLMVKGGYIGLYAFDIADGHPYGEDRDPAYVELNEDGLYIGQHYTRGYGGARDDHSSWSTFFGYRLPLTAGALGQTLVLRTGTDYVSNLVWETPSGGAGSATTSTLVNGTSTITLSSTGNTTFPTGLVLGAPRGPNTVNFTCSVDKEFQIETGTASAGRLWQFGTTGTTTFPSGLTLHRLSSSYSNITADLNKILQVATQTSGGRKEWSFGTDGNLTVPGSIIPDTNVAYDLGSPTAKFRSLYLSTSTIYIGTSTITISDSGQMLVNGNNAVSKLEYFGGEGNGPRDAGYIAWNTSTFTFNLPGKELLTAIYDLKPGNKIRAANTFGFDREFTIVGNARQYTRGFSNEYLMAAIDVAETTSTNVYAFSLYLPVKDKSATLANGTWTLTLSALGGITFPNGSTQTGASISIADLKTLVAASTDFADFKSRIAAL